MGKRNLPIQSMKGIAAVVVMISHIFGTINSGLISTLSGTPLRILFDGECAVMVFFGITGYFTYGKCNSLNLKSLTGGVIKKYSRLFPSFIIVMIIGWLCCNNVPQWNHDLYSEYGNSFWNNKVSVKELLRALTMVYPGDTTLIDPPVWYLAVESKMVVVLPLAIWIFKRYGWSVGILVFFVSAVLPNIPFGLSFLYAYLGGCMVRRMQEENRIPDLKTIMLYPAIIIAILCIDIFNITGMSSASDPHIICAIQAIGVMIILSILSTKEVRWMNHSSLVWLGDISYQLYLVHFVILLTFRSLNMSQPLLIVSTITASIIFSYLLYRVDSYIRSRYITPFIKNISI